MDSSLLLLIALIAGTLVLSATGHLRSWPGRPANAYQRVFSAGAIGLLFTISGLIGWDLSHSRGWFQGTRWVNGPVWWEIGVGLAALALCGFFVRRVPRPAAVPDTRSRTGDRGLR